MIDHDVALVDASARALRNLIPLFGNHVQRVDPVVKAGPKGHYAIDLPILEARDVVITADVAATGEVGKNGPLAE